MNTYDMMIGGDTDDMRIIPMACSRHSRDNIAHSEHNKYFIVLLYEHGSLAESS